MVSPAAAVAATRSASDSVFRCRKEEWFRLQNATTPRLQRFLISRGKLWNRCKETLKNSQTAASILDFKAKLANRCKLFPVSALLLASILDFRARLGNRCKETLKNSQTAALILDFRPRLANRCSTIVVAVENVPPAAQSWGAGRDRMPRRRHNPKKKAAGVEPVPAATTICVLFRFSLPQRRMARLQHHRSCIEERPACSAVVVRRRGQGATKAA